MRSGVRVGVSVLVIGSLGCASNPPPVEVAGSEAGQHQLLGEWFGSYSNPQGNRDGTIWFILTEGDSIAHGEVVMIPDRSGVPPLRADRITQADWERLNPQAIRISFVHVSDGVVSGELAPYRDPDCGCLLTTRFEGLIEGDRIHGEFVSEGDSRFHQTQRGEWEVERIGDGREPGGV